jgi:light-independent protochlorophyllide reductase subunit B
MFRHDFEFVDGHRSHLGDGAPAAAPAEASAVPAMAAAAGVGLSWSPEGEAELAKIPFFVRGKVRKNTETYARERGLAVIDSEALYEAKAHFSR